MLLDEFLSELDVGDTFGPFIIYIIEEKGMRWPKHLSLNAMDPSSFEVCMVERQRELFGKLQALESFGLVEACALQPCSFGWVSFVFPRSIISSSVRTNLSSNNSRISFNFFPGSRA